MARRKNNVERNRAGSGVCWHRCPALSAHDGKLENLRGVRMKKTNPRKRPATQAKDKNGFSNEELQDTWDNVENLSESIKDGYVSVYDLRTVLREEYEIYV